MARGDADTGTKNWTIRRVPLIPDARALFERMRSHRPGELSDARVFRVSECQKALDRACKKVGAERITHHDLRHLFATRCIESGVDTPTVSRWLGHKDGGALAMKTYGAESPRENSNSFFSLAAGRCTHPIAPEPRSSGCRSRADFHSRFLRSAVSRPVKDFKTIRNWSIGVRTARLDFG